MLKEGSFFYPCGPPKESCHSERLLATRNLLFDRVTDPVEDSRFLTAKAIRNDR